MITVTQYKNQNVGVFGLGKAGEATIASLLAGGAQVFAWDDKPVDTGKWAGITVASFNEWPSDIKTLVLSPGVPLTHPAPHAVVQWAKKNNVPVIGDIELLFGACPQAKYVAITGTNGKSTTTTLIGHILKSAGLTVEVGGNLGTAALSLEPLGADGIYVLELSSYQLDLLKTTRFNVAAFLNVTPDHLDRHGDMAGYIKAKMYIFDRQTGDDVAVVAVDDSYTQGIAREWKGAAKLLPVSAQEELDVGVYVFNGYINEIAHKGDEPAETNYRVSTIETLTGRHNWQNAAVAFAVTRACGVAAQVIYTAMQSFSGLRHRLQLVTTIGNVRFINDSKATNADATANALAPYSSIYWIAGGKPKAGGISSLGAYFPHVLYAFLIGEAESEFAATLDGKVKYTRCGTLDEAVKQAASMAFSEGKGDAVVLLSPACASFDQFKSFEQRGDVFCELVGKLDAGAYAKHAI